MAQRRPLVRGEGLPAPLPHLGRKTPHQHRGNQLPETRTAEDREAIQQQQGCESRQHQRPDPIAGTGEFREGGGQQQQGQGQNQNPIAQDKGQPGEGQDHIQRMIYRVLPGFRHGKGDTLPNGVFRVSGIHRPQQLHHGFLQIHPQGTAQAHRFLF